MRQPARAMTPRLPGCGASTSGIACHRVGITRRWLCFQNGVCTRTDAFFTTQYQKRGPCAQVRTMVRQDLLLHSGGRPAAATPAGMAAACSGY